MVSDRFLIIGYVRGAMNYYAKGMKYRDVEDLDGWLHSRMRLYYWKQWG
jgi:hypothetical protein